MQQLVAVGDLLDQHPSLCIGEVLPGKVDGECMGMCIVFSMESGRRAPESKSAWFWYCNMIRICVFVFFCRTAQGINAFPTYMVW